MRTLEPDYSTIPSDYPVNCYAWVSRGPQAGTWRVIPARVEAFRARFEQVRAPEPPPKADTSWRWTVALLALIAFGPGLAVAVVAALLSGSATVTVVSGLVALVLTWAKLLSG